MISDPLQTGLPVLHPQNTPCQFLRSREHALRNLLRHGGDLDGQIKKDPQNKDWLRSMVDIVNIYWSCARSSGLPLSFSCSNLVFTKSGRGIPKMLRFSTINSPSLPQKNRIITVRQKACRPRIVYVSLKLGQKS